MILHQFRTQDADMGIQLIDSTIFPPQMILSNTAAIAKAGTAMSPVRV
jgi:hypothetical protein